MSELLTASNVAFAYGDGFALRDVTLSLSSAEFVSIIGPNGSGKSTLIRALLGQHRATGTIAWEGTPLAAWRLRKLAMRVAYLPQNPTSDPEQSVHDVLRLGRAPYWSTFGIESPRDEQVVESIATLLNLTELLARPMAELSGGQRQRVFIGRCLVQEPVALLLDEPSTFLDLKHQVELLNLLRQLTHEKQMAVLMASHDVNLAAAYSDRMLVLNAGRLVASGKPLNVMNAELLSQVYGVSVRLIRDPTGESPAPILVPSACEPPVPSPGTPGEG